MSLSEISHAGDRTYLKRCHNVTPDRLVHILMITPDLHTHTYTHLTYTDLASQNNPLVRRTLG